MSDQLNQTNEEQEEEVTTAAPEATSETTAEASTNAPVSTAPPAASFDTDDSDDDDSDDDDSDDDFDGDDGDDSDENVVEGPAEYVQREKSGRGRRIGGDVRPEDVDYKNIPLLSRFLDRRGRILSRRKTRVSAKVQRRIVTAIKRARHLALLPYTADQTRIVRSKRR
jgi:small subunit ribosomal protein S18